MIEYFLVHHFHGANSNFAALTLCNSVMQWGRRASGYRLLHNFSVGVSLAENKHIARPA